MKDGSDKSLAIPIGISTHFEPPSLLDLLFEELDFPLEVYVVETFEVLVPDFLHVETVDGADVHALLAADALRVVELGNNDRFPLPVVRPVEHVDATRDRKSTRLNSSHITISYAVFCLKKKTKRQSQQPAGTAVVAVGVTEPAI